MPSFSRTDENVDKIWDRVNNQNDWDTVVLDSHHRLSNFDHLIRDEKNPRKNGFKILFVEPKGRKDSSNIWSQLKVISIFWNVSLQVTSLGCLSTTRKPNIRVWNNTLQLSKVPISKTEQDEDLTYADLSFQRPRNRPQRVCAAGPNSLYFFDLFRGKRDL